MVIQTTQTNLFAKMMKGWRIN